MYLKQVSAREGAAKHAVMIFMCKGAGSCGNTSVNCKEKETRFNFMGIVYLGTACPWRSNCVITRCARSLTIASKRCMTAFVCPEAKTP